MRTYGLYLKKCPGVADPRHWKIGIFHLLAVRARLGTYQNAVGPVWEESFMKVWLGDENQIRIAENQFKHKFKAKISSAEAGLSEWICDIKIEELLEFITELRDEHFLKFIDVPERFLPLTMAMCEDFVQWSSNSDSKDV